MLFFKEFLQLLVAVPKVSLLRLRKIHLAQANQQWDLPFIAAWTHPPSKTTRIKTQNALRRAEWVACTDWNKPTIISTWQSLRQLAQVAARMLCEGHTTYCRILQKSTCLPLCKGGKKKVQTQQKWSAFSKYLLITPAALVSQVFHDSCFREVSHFS